MCMRCAFQFGHNCDARYHFANINICKSTLCPREQRDGMWRAVKGVRVEKGVRQVKTLKAFALINSICQSLR